MTLNWNDIFTYKIPEDEELWILTIKGAGLKGCTLGACMSAAYEQIQYRHLIARYDEPRWGTLCFFRSRSCSLIISYCFVIILLLFSLLRYVYIA
jgi:hypothetical protein